MTVIVAVSARQTEADIRDLRDRVEVIGMADPSPVHDATDTDDLPAPVRRYFDFTFVEAPSPIGFVEMTMTGDFRRPLTEGFSPTSAEQTIAVGTPSLMFSARTSMVPGVWARAYDFYANGEMEMKAKVMSTLTVVDESETPELNQTSLRRWLLESPTYPAALLPGGPVRWEAIDDTHARAIVAADGLEASLVATFRPDGSLESFAAEEDGDLTTPYHGSGEHVLRGDYRLVDGMMILTASPSRGWPTVRRSPSGPANGETFPLLPKNRHHHVSPRRHVPPRWLRPHRRPRQLIRAGTGPVGSPIRRGRSRTSRDAGRVVP
ncbi:MAG: DUF6544 family protein [Ilumatobacteraceae bacterium]